METQISYSQVPSGYPVCLNRECVQAGTCLRQLVEPIIPAHIRCWTIISPKYLATQEGVCSQYRPATKVLFAKGCIGILENLPHKQMLSVVSSLIGHFNPRTYYRIRKGERLLSPAEQHTFLEILKKNGVSHLREFDAYIENYEW
ncbi:MAG: DUF6078 family protein [Tannerellaceae bacterium]|nr:DUF6078 family protein [Tannerellaceae bacterium]